jgi:hypothetical protein
MTRYKKQHYVPVSYLRAWSEDEKRVHMFDKYTGEVRLVGLKSVAQGTYFYDAFRRENGVIEDGLSESAMENAFGEWEVKLSTMRRVALQVASGEGPGTLEDRETMAICAAVQLLRTKAARGWILGEARDPTRRPSGLLAWLPDFMKSRVREDPTFAEREISLLQAMLIWQSGIVPQIATELYHYIWVIAVNETPWPFYTSDSPVAAISHPANKPPYFPTYHPVPAAHDDEVVKRLYSRRGSRNG